MNIIQSQILTILESEAALFIVETASFLLTLSLCFYFISKYYKSTNKHRKTSLSFYFLLITILGLSVENLSWIITLVNNLSILHISRPIIKASIYIAWIFNLLRYQSLGLFLESLTQVNFSIKIHHKIFFSCTAIITAIFCYSFGYQIIIKDFNAPPQILVSTFPHLPIYALLLIAPSLLITFKQLFSKDIPQLIRKQLKIIYSMIIFPHTFFDLMQTFPLFFHSTYYQDNNTGAILSTISINIAFLFFARNIFKFRFLNTTKYISTRNHFNNGHFKETIEQISKASYVKELAYITQNYFKDIFKIPTQNVCLHIRNISDQQNEASNIFCKKTQASIEHFITHKTANIEPIDLFQNQRIIVLDEIEFNAFYTSNNTLMQLTKFLKSIKCSLFVPLFYRDELIAYITIREQESHHFFNINEQNDIYVLGNYLSHMIHMINTTNPQVLLQESQKLKEELFLKHQEVNQYKECMKSLLKKNVHHAAGIIFYKNNSFFYGNKAAQDLVNINLNQQKNHPITHALKEVAQQVLLFKSTQTRFLTKQNDEKLLITGIPHIESKQSVILTIQYPEASDIIKKNLNKLQNPSKWDYALYLETTKSGQLINKLIPSNQEHFLNFKIKLLETALTHKGLLLQCHPDDLQSIAELIHHVSLKEKLHVIDLQGSESKDMYVKLFGINSLFTKEQHNPLLQKLDKIGTLFIKNIEQLDHKTQQELATFINYGYFSPFKSHEKIFSSVRIIGSTNQNPQNLIERGILLPELYDQLHSTILQMPSLITLKEEEIHELVDGVTYQSVKGKHFAHLIQLSDDDYQAIIDRKPASLQELKNKVHSLLAKKSNKHTIFTEKAVDAEFETSNPDLLHAAQLGKYALKDEKLMALLWNTFKSQAKIAQFLGVNRSSVNRRCKEYSLN